MSTLSDLIETNGHASPADIEWLHLIRADTQLLADLSFADIVMWAPTNDDSFVATALTRPGSAATLFFRDIVGQRIPANLLGQVREAYELGRIVDSDTRDWSEDSATHVRAVPVRRGGAASASRPIAVITRHSNLVDIRTPSRQELTFNQSANELFAMIADGAFPDMDAPSVPRRFAPRASDGLIRIDADGVVTFASPNALSAFNRLGFEGELEGESLPESTTELIGSRAVVDESLPLVLTGRAPWRADVEARGGVVALRAIPVRKGGERTGAILLVRDVTEVRRQERELLTKDATIREIHHRVKNNLQTVASLLRIQARRTHSDEARDALQQAMRRVSAIAVVHDTLSEGLSQNVDFDVVFERVLMLVAEVASSHTTRVQPKLKGSFGELPSEYATPLALALTELVTNSVEHGLVGRTDGEVTITAARTDDRLTVEVHDNGAGLPEGKVGSGLGTQIVRTLIQGELSGSIDWHTLTGSGTEVTIEVPLTWLRRGTAV
ncbi:MAG: histidine kinase N-terminal domain-containing protein [Microbacteriaceae bacterium]|nr:histidine kinase N-terminal domain-containing protein [Microbacteriaceae bacterium]